LVDHDGNNSGVIPAAWHFNRNVRFLLFNTLFAVAFFAPLRDLILMSWNSDYYTYIPFIPFISAYLIYDDRQAIFSVTKDSIAIGILVLGFGLLLEIISRSTAHLIASQYRPMINALSMIMFWSGGFAICYGTKASSKAIFPLMFLAFAIPIPEPVLERIIVFLQKGSTEISYAFIQATGIPIARDGFIFHLPTINIEVAKQCSGIRSSLSLVITSLLAAHFYLRTMWARAILLILIVPIAIIKNGIRIAVLSVLGVYWDAGILASDLHSKGGFVFFLIALILIWAVITALKKMERMPGSKIRGS
jgi:exosortase